jgi:hypothetical protein
MSICKVVIPSLVPATLMILVTEDVGDHFVSTTFKHEAHGHTGDWRLERHTRIHHGERRTADRSHRGRTVRLEDFGDDAYHVRKLFHVRHDGCDTATREVAMADFAALRARHHAGLTHRERREVVVQHEGLAALALQRVNDLRIATGAERRDHEGLRLTAREQRRAMGTRQYTDLHGDRANRRRIATVDTRIAAEDPLADDLAFEAEQLITHVISGVLGRFAARQLFGDRLLDLADARVSRLLLDDAVCLGKQIVRGSAHSSLKLRSGCAWLELPTRLAALGNKLVDGLDRDLHLLMAEHHRAEHDLLAEAVCLGLDHHHPVLGAGNDEVEFGSLEFGRRRIEQVLAVFITDARRTDRSVERHARKRKRRRGANHRGDVGIDLGIEGNHRRHNLHVVVETVREERTHGTVDEARR